MPDKDQFMNELVRVTAPGGRVIVVTWCHRELKEGETDLTKKENQLLDKINDGMSGSPALCLSIVDVSVISLKLMLYLCPHSQHKFEYSCVVGFFTFLSS